LLIDLAYDLAGQLASGLVAIAPDSQLKAVRTFRARRGLVERFERWAEESRDLTRRLIWFHAPSYGEGLQARPVLERIRDRHPEIQLAYTFFSPSAAAFAKSLPVDVADYLPFDTRANARCMIEALRPSALIFSKLDVWPRLSEVCRGAGIPSGIVSATMSAAAGRRKPLAHALLRDAYASLSVVGAISEEDGERLIEAGVRRDALEVTGDTRYDQVWARATAPSANAPLIDSLRSDRPTLVAGSTWPEDEDTLLPAWLDVREQQSRVRLVIAPHEPTPSHLHAIEGWATANDLPLCRIGDAHAGRADVILVDRLGVLGDLYSLGTAAFVGGGFGTAGLHSVLEPAAFGVPVLFGPRHDNSRDAGLLIEADAGATVRDPSDTVDVIGRWLGSATLARAAGDAARAVVQRGLGAADRAYALVMRVTGVGEG
jgi:3-deoxy-D-manno-octulosonic-acid transferase